MTKLNVDRRPSDDDLPDDMPSLWAPRGVPSMTATKIGWGTGLCGAAGTIHIAAQSTPSCIALRVELIAIVREALATTEPHRKKSTLTCKRT
jgi:aerobic-type carbon monoxide dehydrogenase small subunit (CoxS/CutS family)